jgi:transposase
MLYTFEEVLEILIFRFKCKACNRTFGLLPSFIERYQSVAVDVKEQVISELDNGVPLRVVAEQLDFTYTAILREKPLALEKEVGSDAKRAGAGFLADRTLPCSPFAPAQREPKPS